VSHIWHHVTSQQAIRIRHHLRAAMASLKPLLKSLLSSLPAGPVDKGVIDSLVTNTLLQAEGKSSVENRKTQWEYLLKDEVLTLAVCTHCRYQSVHPTKLSS
jgi:hypothetical protein